MGDAQDKGDTAALLVDAHKAYIKALDSNKETFEYYATEHLRMSGVYWALCAMDVLGARDEMPLADIRAWVLKCQGANGGFGGNIGHDPHLLYTLSAVQILVIVDALDDLDKDRVVEFVAKLQQEDGSFVGDEWGEVDTRFSYCALSCLSILGRLDAVDVAKATAYVAKCKNFDGGFGCTPGAESHAGQIFCCVAALAIGGAMEHVDNDLLGWWLCERQVPAGGLNGRPEKKPDVCYSWWILSALSIVRRIDWISKDKLSAFILDCQDADTGGIADRKGDMVDVFHTFFGIAGLSLLGYPGLKQVDPVYALTTETARRCGLKKLYKD